MAATDLQKLFDNWREADAAAREAEREVQAAYMKFMDGKGEPPSRELQLRVRVLRRAATDRLTCALTAADKSVGKTPPF
ncbi:hypothetical protein EZ313_21280 [Ramlibacter henchirensis]|uniref:Uncharacterized protein n=1 Tax=Ramlibacter henchirensis TaxID=204072 RepID=A0A4Z0BSF8_9BURK|nr:hypothetical protein [Ramlibacter henchirensis]TFZ00965.1 hypothetical protein EZ313_21280 [Ramlibacter henchirensis]